MKIQAQLFIMRRDENSDVYRKVHINMAAGGFLYEFLDFVQNCCAAYQI